MTDILATLLDALSDAKTAMEEVSAKDNRSARIVSAAIHKAREAHRLYDQEAQTPSKTVMNEKCYVPYGKPSPYKQITLEVTAILDMVPGAWHQPEDLMKWIADHSYVQYVQLKTVPPRVEKAPAVTVPELTREEQVNQVYETLNRFAVLSGRVTSEQAERVITDLQMLAATKREPITIRIGGQYRNAAGSLVTILSFDSDNEDRFIGDDQISYDENGRWSFLDDAMSSKDLIEVVSAPSDQYVEQQDLLSDAPLSEAALSAKHMNGGRNKRIEELEECLRETRYLVGKAAMDGFLDPESIQAVFKNNGAINRLVPSRPEDRARYNSPSEALAAERGSFN